MSEEHRDDDVVGFLSAPADAEALARLHRRLEAEADTAGVLDVAYTTVDSPIGPLLLAATERGLVRVAFAREDHDAVLQVLAQGSVPACCGRHDASMRSPGSSMNTSRGAAGHSTCRSTCRCRRDFASWCSATCRRSGTGGPQLPRGRRPRR